MNSIEDIKHAFYINLETRPDRKKHAETQFKLLGITATRFNAIKLQNGALGCSMSHLKCLEFAKINNLPHILIVEDDIEFLHHELFKNQLNSFLQNYKKWDVILIAGNNIGPYQQIDSTCVKVSSCQTTTGYLVNNHYFDTLIDNYRTGIQKFLKFQDQPNLYAIDKFWFSLQQQDNWYLIIPLTVSQREDYSDIEKKPTNYSRVMLDLDKEYLKQYMMKEKSTPKLNLFNL